jgi:hypothetical protein
MFCQAPATSDDFGFHPAGGVTLLNHPVFQIELLTNNRQRLSRTSSVFWYAPDRTAKSITRCCSGLRLIDTISSGLLVEWLVLYALVDGEKIVQ